MISFHGYVYFTDKALRQIILEKLHSLSLERFFDMIGWFLHQDSRVNTTQGSDTFPILVCSRSHWVVPLPQVEDRGFKNQI